MLKKSLFAGCSKRPRCKAPKILRSEAYLEVRRNDEGRGQRCRWAFFSGLLDKSAKFQTQVARAVRINQCLFLREDAFFHEIFKVEIKGLHALLTS